jgi:hypothetical protein
MSKMIANQDKDMNGDRILVWFAADDENAPINEEWLLQFFGRVVEKLGDGINELM